MRRTLVGRRLSEGTARRKPSRPMLEYVERRVLLSTFTVQNTADDGEGSLRWAIVQVNADDSPSTIAFNILGPGVKTIHLNAPLDPIVRPVVIEGRSQPGYVGQPLIRLDGSGLASGQSGLVIASGNSIVAGLVVSGFPGAGIVLTGGGGNFVESSYIGVDPTGASAVPNGDGIVILGSSHNTIGGIAGAGNLISGNTGVGIKISNALGDAVANAILGNWIGTNRQGTAAVGNQADGVLVAGGRGGAIRDNVISGNRGNGLVLGGLATENVITGNVIGLTADGLQRLGNLRDGILLNSAPANTIGGLSRAEANQISGNLGSGVRTQIDTTGLVLQGNQIGTDATGTLALGNGGNGVSLGTSANMIGGTSTGSGNVIAYNGTGVVGAGVQLIEPVDRNSILSNVIHENAGLGINLGNGPTPNHSPNDGPGPNGWQNFPILTTALGDGGRIQSTGRLFGAELETYLVQIFWSRRPDPSGFGEGQQYLGECWVTTDSTGEAVFSLSTPSAEHAGFLSATATDAMGNTSEFSQAVVVRPSTDLKVSMTANPARSAPGAPVSFTVIVTNQGDLDAHHVVLSARFPSNATVVYAESTQGLTSIGLGANVAAEVGVLAPGASASLVIIVQARADFVGNLAGTVLVTMDETDAQPGDNTASATVRIATSADLSLRLSSGPTSASIRDTLTYVLTVSNSGPGTASNVVLTLPFGAGATYVGATGTQGTGRLQTDQLSVSLGTLASGATASVTVQLKANQSGLYATTAYLTSEAFDTKPGDESIRIATDVFRQADLRLVMTAPPQAADDHDFRYAVTVTNDGPDDARNVTILDLIPANATYVSASLEGGSVSFANGIVTGVVGTLANGQSATLWILVRPASSVGANLVNAARVSSDEEDPAPSNNSDWRETPVRPISDLGITMRPLNSKVAKGSPATFEIVVTNQGPAAEPNAVLSIPLPDWATLVSASSTPGVLPSLENGVIIARFGPIDVGGTARATIVLAPKPGAANPLAVSAFIQGDDFELNLADNTASAMVTQAPSANLSITLTPPTSVFERSPFQYTLNIANPSSDNANGVQVTAPLPSGLEFLSAVSSQGAAPLLDSGRVVAALGNLPANGLATVTITVRTTTRAGADLLLSGNLACDEFDTDPDDDSAVFAATVQPTVDLMVRLTTQQTTVDLGGNVVWIADVWNSGPSPATGVVLSLPIAEGGTLVGTNVTQGGVQFNAGGVVASLGTIASGAYATIAIMLTPQAAGVATLVASVRADQHDLNPSDDQSMTSLSVLETPGMVQFSQPAFAVPETIGYATIPVERSRGALGTVTVRYQTTGGSAVAGLDYQPVSGVLTFGPGEILKYVTVPVFANPHSKGDGIVGLILDVPTDGAVLGSRNVAYLTIQDLDPDYLPPRVEAVRLVGDSNSITGLAIAFSEPLLASSALNGAAYTLLDLGPTGILGDGDDLPIGYYPPSYDSAMHTITFTPLQPLASGRQYAIVLVGAGPFALTDLAGNPLSGASNGIGGVDYVGLFARGASLKYADSNGDMVSFQLSGGGYLDLTRYAAGDARILTLQGGVPGRTTLSGSVARQKGRGDGVTTIDGIEGLGAFGQIRVNLKSPPFQVKELPFSLTRSKPVPLRQPIVVARAPVRPTPLVVAQRIPSKLIPIRRA